ncbi:hypothetical protein BH23GEM9_BH23GEM9_23330 [soil metagenome]
MTDPFRVVALLSAYNEGDIIAAVIGHLLLNGIDVYLLDNHSTDDTVEQARRFLGSGLLNIERFPPIDTADNRDPPAAVYDWTAILRRKEELSRELTADWFMHHDADEIRESPLPGLTLRDAIRWVDALGCNCIDHLVLNFPPVDDGYQPGVDPQHYFRYYEEAAEYDRTQLKAWKRSDHPVTLTASGGHQAEFPDRRVFPLPFLIRHYPVRSQAHGLRKVFAERKGRFVQRERDLGWHVQYDSMVDEQHVFTRDPAELKPFDLEQFRLQCLLSENARNFGERLLRMDATLHAVNIEKEDLLRRLDEHQRHAATLEHDRDALRQHATNMEQEHEALRQHATALEQERDTLRQHATALEQERDALRQHASALEKDRDELKEHATALEQTRDELHQRTIDLDRQRIDMESRHDRLAGELAGLRGSYSWRWTAPFRWVERLFRRG